MIMIEACLVGATGLVGSQIVSTLVECPAVASIFAYSRRDKTCLPDSKIKYAYEPDTVKWPSMYPPGATVLFSALGTTARAAGGFEKQREIDYDLNLALAKAAKNAGTTICVIISTSGASTTSRIPYSKMKGQLDEALKAIKFQHLIILKPGLLVGNREDSRPGEFVARKLATFLGAVSDNRLKDTWAQDADVVAKAAVEAVLEAVRAETKESVRILDQKDIVRLGREEYEQNARKDF